MLTSLWIKHFAIVAELELDFQSGMTAFTGETGAGKSIMIDALMLALGERADTGVVRPGKDSCDIQASFSYAQDSSPAHWLTAHDVPHDEEQIILRRVITHEGRSKAYINGVPFPLQKVKELSETLVHIHGQHQHQTLLLHTTHREQLDQFADHADLRQKLAGLYRKYQRLKEEKTQLAQSHAQDMQDVSRDLQELQTLNPMEGEIDRLHQEHQLLHHAKDYIEQTQSLIQMMQADDAPNLHQYMHAIVHSISTLPQHNAHIQTAKSLLENAAILLEEAYDELESFGQTIQMDPERLGEVEARMSALHHLARKCHIPVHQLHTHIQVLEQQLHQHQHLEERKKQIEQDLLAAQAAYHGVAMELRSSRIQHAKILAKAITTNIQQLGMPDGFIEIDITSLDTMQAHGLDKIEYKVSTNPGMQPDLLSKIASGGELSRISLAIQMIAAQQGATPTLFFDEVDVGIGGATAAIVGRHLRQLGTRLQVFCVTHQPQVAASAHQHFLVKKYVDQEQTFSQIIGLDTTQKVEELARMLGGLTITQQTRSNAQELIDALTQE
ncbi:MAG: DNA repair protein RecN [Legionella sp.]|nr:MAG: DNA repair protein RecN [Legionella sp.]